MNYSNRMKKIFRNVVVSWIVIFFIGLILGSILMFMGTRIVGAEVVSTPAPEYIEYGEPTPEVTESMFEDLGKYTITAYCSCEKCCGTYAKNRPKGIVRGAMGIQLTQGISVAAPELKFETIIAIEGLGAYAVEDRTSSWIAQKYNNKIIDIYFNNHADALKFGKVIRNIKIVKGGEIND